MKEIFKEWRMVRLLVDNQYDWGISIFEDDPIKGVHKYFRLLLEKGQIRVRKIQLLAHYNFEVSEKIDIRDKKELIKVGEARSILYSCESKGYIEEVRSDSETLLRVTNKGKQFGTIDGLVIEISERLKPLKTAGLFTLVGIVIKTIVEFLIVNI